MNQTDSVNDNEILAARWSGTRWWAWLALILVFQALASFLFLDFIRLGTHEQLAALRSRELMTHGHWVVPHLNGKPNLFKPPLPFWMTDVLAVALSDGQVNEWNARVPSVLAALALTVVIALLTRSLISHRGASLGASQGASLGASPGVSLLAAFMFSSSVSALVWGRRAEVDIQLAFWTALVLAFYWLAISCKSFAGGGEDENKTAVQGHANKSGFARAFTFTLLGWLAMSVAVMTKGPLPIIQLLVVVLVMGICIKKWPGFVSLWAIVPGVAIFLACSLPWLTAVYKLHPDVFQVWHDQTIGRMSQDNMSSGHPKPLFFYLSKFWVLVLPWLVPLAVGLWQGFRGHLRINRRAWIFLLAWGLGTLVFLSLVSGKRVRYALVCVAPFFIIAAIGMDYLWSQRDRLARQLWLGVRVHLILVPASVIGAVVVAIMYPVTLAAMAILAIVVPVGLIASYRYFRCDRVAASLVSLAIVLLVTMPVISAMVAPHLETLSKNTGVAIGRYISSSGIQPDLVCFYQTSNMGTVFYAGAPIPNIKSPEKLVQWRLDHPGGYVIVRDQRGLNEIRSVGNCEAVDYFGDAVRPKRSRYNLWRFSGEPKAQ